MDLTRRVYPRDLKFAAMQEIDGGRTMGDVAWQQELTPSCWRGGVGGLTPGFTASQRIAG